MDLIYQETQSVDGQYTVGSDTLTVKVYAPSDTDVNLPSLTEISIGKRGYDSDRMVSSTWIVNVEDKWTHHRLIRKAIALFDNKLQQLRIQGVD